MFTGKLADPDFEGNPYAIDKEYVEFISKGCENSGINFAGRYTIIEKSCGCMCEHIFIVDRSSGKIFTEAMLATTDGEGRFGYTYKKDSKMIIADSGLFTDDSFTHYTCIIKPLLKSMYGRQRDLGGCNNVLLSLAMPVG
jgi:hypothetical protein